jgi:sugar/nucleoside kinase (ribokinase family)
VENEAREGPSGLAVSGHTNLDLTIRVAHLPRTDRTEPCIERRETLGGTAANIARWSARLGVRTRLLSVVGEDFPPSYREILSREGVDLSGFQVRPKSFTPTCWIIHDRRDRQVTVIDQGAMARPPPEWADRAPLSGCRVVHLTTGDPDVQLRLARRARRDGLVVAADPAQEIGYRWDPVRLERLLRLSEIMFANQTEIEIACRKLRCRGPSELLELVPLVVVTLGNRGARAYTRRGSVRVSGPKVLRISQVTGGGDAFRAGFYRGWFSGRELSKCLSWGLEAGRAAVSRRWMETPMFPVPRALRSSVLGLRPAVPEGFPLEGGGPS